MQPLANGAAPTRACSASADALHARVGAAPFASGWIDIDQTRVGRFADATGDHQRIHVDPERAARNSRCGGPIAHGLITLPQLQAWRTDAHRYEQRSGLN
ncbi:dehydratase, partial [Burkholderia pseudomallei]